MMQQDAAVNAPPQEQQTIVNRGPAEPSEARKALVKEILETIKDDKAYFEKNFKAMRKWMRFARGMQWEKADSMSSVEIGDDDSDDRYVANIVQRHIQQEVSSLYAKNPTVVAKRAQRLDFKIWDGKMSTVASAMTALSSGMIDPANPQASAVGMQAVALQQDIAQGVARRNMLDKVAQSLEILYTYNMNNYLPNLKRQMKQMVRRTKICGVAFAKLGYQRAMQHSPDALRQIDDITARVAEMQRLAADLADGEVSENSAEAEKLKLSMEQLQSQPDVIVYEGLTWNFPKSTAIIPDMQTVSLDGWIGSNHVSEEYVMTAKDIQRVYGIDIKSAKGEMKANEKTTYRIIRPRDKKRKGEESEYLVYIQYDKLTGMEYHVCDGYCDFLQPPAAPFPQLERFFPYFTLAFNDVEDENEIYPLSDVELMRHSQIEHNRAREGLSQHREHAKPMYVSKKPLEDEDRQKLKDRVAFEIITLNATNSQESINDIIQQFENAAIDPNLYSTEHLQADMQLTVGADDAALGMAGGGDTTATESSIAAGARSKSTSSNVDDLDDLLTQIAREGGQVLLMEVSPQTVQKIVGPGAVWPQLSRAEIAQEIYLTIQAGSSGRPNRAQDLANFERAAPLLLQMPGINPESFGRYGLRILDDSIDLEEMVADGLPSMVAMNAMASKPQPGAPGAEGGGGQPQPSTGSPSTDPAAQGPQGANNAPQPAGAQQQGQPGMGKVNYGPDGRRMQ